MRRSELAVRSAFELSSEPPQPARLTRSMAAVEARNKDVMLLRMSIGFLLLEHCAI
jgi:hypothetical protein